MTKERKLAIQMWQEIKNKIADNPDISDIGIYQLKQKFCIQHGLHWKGHCWLCQYMPSCELCPLQDCSVYKVARASFFGKEKRLRACDKIIAALKGEYRDERG